MTGEAPPAAPEPKARVTAKRQRALDDANAKRKKAARQAKSEALQKGDKVRRKPAKSSGGLVGDTELRRAMKAAVSLFPLRRLTDRGVSEQTAAALLGYGLDGKFHKNLSRSATAKKAMALARQMLTAHTDPSPKGSTADSAWRQVRRKRAAAAPIYEAEAARPAAFLDTSNRIFRPYEDVEAQGSEKDPWAPGVMQPRHPDRMSRPEVPPFTLTPRAGFDAPLPKDEPFPKDKP